MKIFVVVTTGDEVSTNAEIFQNRKDAEESIAYSMRDIDVEEEDPLNKDCWRGFDRATHGYVEYSIHEKEI